MPNNRKRTVFQAIALVLPLCLTLCLLAGCGKSVLPAPTAVHTFAPTAAPEEPTQAPPEDREIVYIPRYEVYPAVLDNQTGFTAEREDGVWFFRQVESGGEWYFCLMHGSGDAADAVTAVTFDTGAVPDWMCFLSEDRVWVKMTDFQTWETVLREISPTTGETLREILFPGEDGSPVSIFDLPDGSLGVNTNTGEEECIYKLEEDGSFSLLTVLDHGEDRGYLTFLGTDGSGLPYGECMAYDEKGLLAVDLTTGAWRELLHWADWGIGVTVMPMGMRDGVVRLLDYGYGEAITVTPMPRSWVKPRQELTLACLTVENETLAVVQDFNRRSGEYYVTIRDYSGGEAFTRDVQDRAITAMNLDIVNGNMPDLLSIQDGVPFKSYGEKGFLRDLSPWLAEEGIELLPQLRRAGTVDGKLLMVCGSFNILTATGNRDVIGEVSGWSMAEASALAASLPDCVGVFPSKTTFESYLELLDSYLEGYLDWDKGTASFDSPGFRDVLAFAAALPTEANGEGDADAEIMRGQALANAVTVASIRDWQLWDLTYMGKLTCPGIPASDGVGSLLQMRSPMAVSAVSKNPEGAYAFLRSLLDEKTQNAYTTCFPALKTAFEGRLAEAMREPTAEEGYHITYIMASGFRMEESAVHLWDGSEGERIPRGIVQWYDGNFTMIREEKLYPMSEEQRDALLTLLDSAARSTSYDQVIAGIVREEAGAYFAGQRSADEVSQRIQSRVEIYMAEQG